MGNAMTRKQLAAGLLVIAIAALIGCSAQASPPGSASQPIAYNPCAVPSMSYGPGKAEEMAGICKQTLPPASGTTVPWLDSPYSGSPAAPTPTLNLEALYAKCSSADLEVGFAGWTSGDLTDRAEGWLVIRTKGSVVCLLEGGPQVSLLDASGAVLGSGVGGDGPPPPAVLRPGLAKQPSAAPSNGPLGPELVPGYAYSSIDVSGYCDPVHPAAAIDVAFPDGTHFKFPVPTLPVASCTSIMGQLIGEGWFQSVDRPQPTTLPASSLQPIVSLPQRAVVGQVMHFTVALVNNYEVPISLDPCPGYTIRVTILTSSGHEDGQLVKAYTLNCGPVGTIAPKGSMSFDMQISIPADAPPSDDLQVDWWLGPPESLNLGPVTHLVQLVAAQ
jgi:hypothetical protein